MTTTRHARAPRAPSASWLAQKESVQLVVQHTAYAGVAVGDLHGGQPFCGLGADHRALGVITTNLRLFMVGPFPPEQVWRVWLCLASRHCFLVFRWTVARHDSHVGRDGRHICRARRLPFGMSTRIWHIAILARSVSVSYRVTPQALTPTNARRRKTGCCRVLVAFALSLVLLQAGKATLAD